MIVVSLTSEVFYPILPGGLAQYFRYGPGLQERGVQLRVHTTLRPEHGDETELSVHGVEIYRHLTTEGVHHVNERDELVDQAILQMRRDPAEFSHCIQPNGESRRSTASLWRAKMAGVPSTFYYTMFPEMSPQRLDQRLRHRLRWRLMQATYSRLIVCSKRMQAAYHEYAGIPVRKMSVLPNGVDLERFSPGGDQADYRRRLKLPETGPIVVTCGSVVPRKGTDVLLDAWERVSAEIPDATLVICGSMGMRPTFRHESMRRELVEFTEKIEQRLAANPSVIIAGEVDDVSEYHRAADAFVFTSWREGLPNAVIEAMSSGLPCVLAPFAGIPDDGEEFGNDDKHFVRSSHDPSTLAGDLLGLLRRPEKQLEMGKCARELMVRTQHMDTALDTLAEVYRSVVRAR